MISMKQWILAGASVALLATWGLRESYAMGKKPSKSKPQNTSLPNPYRYPTGLPTSGPGSTNPGLPNNAGVSHHIGPWKTDSGAQMPPSIPSPDAGKSGNTGKGGN